MLLFRLADTRLDLALTATVALVVIWSRFAFLANGPWEWDETLFARGILHFELAAHFPHPPGFPGWLAIGHLVRWLVPDPLSALQVASAAFSVAALWVLAALGRRVAPPQVAAAAAVMVLAAPGPWLFAVRGFTTTAASVLALGAAALAVSGLEGRRVTVFTVLVTASLLVRPNLIPVLAILWLGVASGVRPPRRLLPGLALGSAAVAVAVAMMVRAEGGWRAFATPFLVHSRRHFSRLVFEPGGLADLGLVKGFGGTAITLIVGVMAVSGIVTWAWRVGRRGAWLWTAVLVVAVAQLLWMQNRTYSRYAVGVQMALAPLVAGSAAAVASPAVACGGLLALAAWMGAHSLPMVVEQHAMQLPAWVAVQRAREAALAGSATVVLEPELFPFASYLWHATEERGVASPSWVLSPWDPESWAGVDGPYVVATIHRGLYPDPLFGREQMWGGVSEALQPLTQQRFLEGWVIEDVPLPLAGWWAAERLPNGRRFMWGGPEAAMLLPPLPAGARLEIHARKASGPDPVVVRLDGREVARLEGEGVQTLRVVVTGDGAGRCSLLRFVRQRGWVPGGGDSRSLAIQLFEMRAFARDRPWAGPVASRWQRDAVGIELDGAWEPEGFADAGQGVWLRPRALLVIPANRGELVLRLWAPRPTPPATVLFVGGRQAVGPLELGPRPQEVAVRLAPQDCEGGRCRIEIVSERYVPTQGDDRRELGVVISDISFAPQEPGP